MKEIVIQIGGVDYEVPPLKIKPARIWRETLSSKFDVIVNAMTGAGIIEVKDLKGIGELVDSLRGTLIGSIDTVFDLVCSYAPAIEKDRERIEEDAYDEEIIEAFTKILVLAFPLGKILLTMSGLAASTTSKN